MASPGGRFVLPWRHPSHRQRPADVSRLISRTSVLLKEAIGTQSPQIEATSPDDLDALFLDGTVRPADPYYLISASGSGWTLNAGAVHGLPRGVGSEVVGLALFPVRCPSRATP